MLTDADALRAAVTQQWQQANSDVRITASEFWANVRRQREAGRVFSSMEELFTEWFEFCGLPPEEAGRRAPDAVAAWQTELRRKLT